MNLRVNEKFHHPLRALIAISIGLLCYQVSSDQFSSWILWTVVVLLQTTTGATLRKSISRVAGTLVGILAGMLLIALLPYNQILYYSIILPCLFFLIYTDKINYFISMLFGGIGIIFVLILFLSHGALTDAWHFATARALDTAIGAVIVISVAYLFWPRRVKEDMEKNLCDTFEKGSAYILILIEQCMKRSPASFKGCKILGEYSSSIARMRVQILEAKYDVSGFLSKLHIMKSIVACLMRIEKIMFVLSIYLPKFISEANSQTLEQELMDYLKSLHELFFKLEKFVQTGQYQIEGDGLTSINQLLLMNIANRMAKFEISHEEIILSGENEIAFHLLLSNLRGFCVQLEYIFSALRQMRR